MPNQVEYTVAQYDGVVSARAKVNSFNLDHVIDKDISSYYKQISSRALFDTGLLPLNGTGVLAIRSAGNHTQIAFQHAPQISYINWGATEGDPRAKTYMLAQPYRIWIADLIDGNLYGARMFYSPYPITSPESQLYHLNLPNTNCKGYRGNGVGWICLYHNEEWSNLSFNVKIQKLIERCSGIEAYNDANMSETDGPNFYRQNNKPEYLWNPKSWQEKSLNEGTDWTLDENLWIPVLVTGLDDQDRHNPNGQPLTFAMALLGKYNSYYNDDIHPKLVNAFAREDVKISNQTVFDIFKNSHNSSLSHPEHYDQLGSSVLDKISLTNSSGSKNQLNIFDPNSEDNDEDEDDSNYFICVSCEEKYDSDENESYSHNGDEYCESCFQECFVYCENTDNYLPNDSDYLIYIEHEGIHIDSSQADIENCQNCDSPHWSSKNSNSDSKPIYSLNKDNSDSPQTVCSVCIDDYVYDNHVDAEYTKGSCPVCKINTYIGISEFEGNFFPVKQIFICSSLNQQPDPELVYTENFDSYDFSKIQFDNSYIFCKEHAKVASYCPSGIWTSSGFIQIEPWVSPPIPLNSRPEIKLQIKIDAISAVALKKNYSNSDVHPFTNDAVYIRAMAAIHYELFSYSSPHFKLYHENGEEYIPDVF